MIISGHWQTYDCSDMRDHSMRWNLAVALQEPTGYGIDVGWFGVIPGYLQQKVE